MATKNKDEVVKTTQELAKDAGASTPNVPAQRQATSLATAGGLSFADDAKMGLEGVDKDSFAIPFLAVLQGLSPQMETVEGAKLGMLINTVTNQLYKECYVLPIGFQRRFLRWTPRSEGGGYKGQMLVSEVEALVTQGKAMDVEDDKGRKNLTFEGDHLKDTRIHFVFIVDKEVGSFTPAVLSMASSQIKRSKRWLSLINGLQMEGPNGPFTPPSFSHIYKVETEKETNKEGSWYSFKIALDSQVEDVFMYNAAKEFHKQVISGDVKVAPPQPEEQEVGGDAGEGGKF